MLHNAPGYNGVKSLGSDRSDEVDGELAGVEFIGESADGESKFAGD